MAVAVCPLFTHSLGHYLDPTPDVRRAAYEAGVPWQPRPTGRPWPLVVRVDGSRALARLERRGLVLRLRPGGRTTRVRLTPAGFATVRQLQAARRDG